MFYNHLCYMALLRCFDRYVQKIFIKLYIIHSHYLLWDVLTITYIAVSQCSPAFQVNKRRWRGVRRDCVKR